MDKVNIVNNLKVPFSGTVVKNTQRHACCTKRLEATGDEINILPLFGVSEGKAEVKHFKSLEECSVWFAEIEESGVTDTYFLSGVPTSEPLDDGMYKVRSLSKAVKDSISLSDKYFSYTQMPTLGLIDYDSPQSAENAKYHEKITEKGLMTALHECMPELGLDELSYIYRDSTSAGILITEENGNAYPYKSMEGIHLFFLISNGTKFEELLKYMFRVCVLSGLFWVEPDKLGRGMIKTPIDTAPSKPYTPRITAPARLINSPGTKWTLSRSNLRKIEYINKQNAMLDASNIPTHAEEKISQCEEIIKIAVAKYNAQPDVAAKIEAHKVGLKRECSGTKNTITQNMSRAIDSMVDRDFIFGDFLVYFDGDDAPVTASILAASGGEIYDGATAHDPLDPSAKNKGKSIFYWNEGVNPYLYNHKHGGYGLRIYAEEPLSSNDWMNRYHAQVLVGNKILYAVDKEDIGSISQFEERLSFISATDLKSMHAGEYAHDEFGNDICDAKGKSFTKVGYWLKWSGRNTFSSVGFEPVPGLQENNYDPLNVQASMLNTYRGFAVTPVKGDVTIFQDFLLVVICNGDVELCEYVTKWVARMVQKPNEQGQTALVIKSLEGTGKTLFWCLTIGSFFGQAFFETANGDDVLGNFNGALANSVFVNFNEAIFGGDKTAQGKLKQLITDEKFTVRKLYQEVRQCKNYTHIVFTSNNPWVVGAGESDRRYAIFKMGEKMPKAYYKGYVKWLESGGREAALHYFLYEINISDFDPRDIPAAAGADSIDKLQQQVLGAGNMVNFMLHILSRSRFYIKTPSNSKYIGLKKTGIHYDEDDGYLIGWVTDKNGSDATLTIPKDVFFDEFRDYCRDHRYGQSPDITTLGRFLKGSISGDGDEVFAVECQKFKDIYPTGKRWRFSWQGVVNALNSKFNSSCIGEMVDIGNVMDYESGLSPYSDDAVDS